MTSTIADSVTGKEERPRLRPDVVFGPPLRERDTVVYHVKDRATGWYYRLGPREYFILSRLDGDHTTPQIADEYLATFGRRLGPDHWTQIFTLLHKRRLLAGAHRTSDDRGGDDLADLVRLREDAVLSERRSRRTLLMYRFPLVHPDRLLAWLSRRTGLLYSPFFVVPALLAAIGVQAVTIAHFSAIRAQVSGSRGSATFIVATVGAFWLLATVHECAHGLTCRRHGANVPEIGIMWRFPLLVPYCRTDDVMLLPARRHRVYAAFAGVFSTLVASLPLAALWFVTSGTAHAVVGSMLLYCCVGSMANFVPFLRLDGYYMLTHALNLADLRGDTYRFWGHLLRGRRDAVRSYRRADRLTYTIYGVCSLLFALTLCAFILVIWFTRLRSWLGPMPAAATLVAETMLLVGLAVYVRHRRARRS